jgi:hypothetical protein
VIGLYVFWKMLFYVTPAGLIVKALDTGISKMSSIVNEIELRHLHDEQKKGINLVEEVFSEKTHGTIEPFFPACVRLEDLPGGFEKAVGHEVCGKVLWKISEWNDFWIWVQILLHNSSSEERQPLGRDGLWLVAVGRERWADEEMQAKAFATSEKYREIWEAQGMWREQSSS